MISEGCIPEDHVCFKTHIFKINFLIRLTEERRSISNCDTVIYNKTYTCGLHPVSVSGFLKPLEFGGEQT